MKMIKGYYARYWVSQSGNVYDILKLKRVEQRMATNGYMSVSLRTRPIGGVYCGTNEDGEPVRRYYDWFLVHRLVAETCIPNESPWRTHVNHKNCVNLDNSVSNLEWTTNKENIRHAYIMGRHTGGRFDRKMSQFSTYSVATDKGTYNKFAGIKNGQIATGYMNKGLFYPNYKNENSKRKVK